MTQILVIWPVIGYVFLKGDTLKKLLGISFSAALILGVLAVAPASAAPNSNLSYYQIDTQQSPGIAPRMSVPGSVGGGVICTLDTGYVYLRTSGGVGGHPKTTCTAPVSKISHVVSMYKTVWFGLQWLGDFVGPGNQGVASYEQLNVSVACSDTRTTTFRMEVTGTVVYLGKIYKASAYQTATLACGTIP